MRNITIFCLLVLAFSSQAADFPEKIWMKSPTRSFTHEFDVAIHEGKIWYRGRVSPESDAVPWQLLGKTGLPGTTSFAIPGLRGFNPPAFVTQLSADGDNLIAVGNDGFIYYMKWRTRRWTDRWGQPFSKNLRLPEKIRSWSVSHRGPFAGGYSDIDGNFHPISAGVTTLYTLSEDGLNIHYADPWLPADFSSCVCGPLRNRFRARALAASASTLFIINDAGEMYTRLADYDTLGNNPFLRYTYERRVRDPFEEVDARTLPPEEWKRQPSIPPNLGRISSAVMIMQTGKGNDARELRVEGVNTEGQSGFFSKSINGATWNFIRTDQPLQKPLLSTGANASDPGPDIDQHLSGHIRTGREGQGYDAELRNFNPVCSDALLVVALGSERVQFPFLTTASSRTALEMKGAVILPADVRVKAANNPVLRNFIHRVFGSSTFVRIRLEITGNGSVEVRKESFLPDFSGLNMEFSGYRR